MLPIRRTRTPGSQGRLPVPVCLKHTLDLSELQVSHQVRGLGWSPRILKDEENITDGHWEGKEEGIKRSPWKVWQMSSSLVPVFVTPWARLQIAKHLPSSDFCSGEGTVESERLLEGRLEPTPALSPPVLRSGTIWLPLKSSIIWIYYHFFIHSAVDGIWIVSYCSQAFTALDILSY